MCNITSKVLIQVAKIKRWLGKECSTEMQPLKSCLFKLTRIFFIFYINNTYCAFLDYGTLTILKCLAERFVRLLFGFTCSFVFMISVYSDVNSCKLFLYVSAYFYLPIGGGLQHMGDIRRKWVDLKSRRHHYIYIYIYIYKYYIYIYNI